jgi:hypothetical protein
MSLLTVVLYKAAFSLPDPVSGPGVNEYQDPYGAPAALPPTPGGVNDYPDVYGGVADPTWDDLPTESPATQDPWAQIPQEAPMEPPAFIPGDIPAPSAPPPQSIVSGIDSSWATPQQAPTPPAIGAGADYTEGAPKPEPFGGDLGTPSNPTPPITPEAQFMQDHGGAFDPNSRVDREKMEIVKAKMAPPQPAPIVSNDSLNPAVPIPGVADPSWDQDPGPEFAQQTVAPASLPSAPPAPPEPLMDPSWNEVPGATDVTSPPASAAPPAPSVSAPPPAPPVADPSWGGPAAAPAPPVAPPQAAPVPAPPRASAASMVAPAGQELVGIHSGVPQFAPASTPPASVWSPPRRDGYQARSMRQDWDLENAATEARNSGQLGQFFASRNQPEMAKAFPSPISDSAATKLTGLAPKTNTTYRSAPASVGMKSSIGRRPGR